MSLTGRHTWETDTAVVFEQMKQNLFMLNLTWEVLHFQGNGTDYSNFCHVKLGKDLKMFCADLPRKFNFEFTYKKCVSL